MTRCRLWGERILIFIALGASLLMTWNYAMNLHTHVRPDGTTITHAHPNHTNDEPLSGSNHTQSELYLLQTLMVIAMPNPCIVLEKVFRRAHTLVEAPLTEALHNRQLFHKKGRAPPQSSSCILFLQVGESRPYFPKKYGLLPRMPSTAVPLFCTPCRK